MGLSVLFFPFNVTQIENDIQKKDIEEVKRTEFFYI